MAKLEVPNHWSSQNLTLLPSPTFHWYPIFAALAAQRTPFQKGETLLAAFYLRGSQGAYRESTGLPRFVTLWILVTTTVVFCMVTDLPTDVRTTVGWTSLHLLPSTHLWMITLICHLDCDMTEWQRRGMFCWSFIPSEVQIVHPACRICTHHI
jgi:hypothetical protein